jgi:hypothetical protein
MLCRETSHRPRTSTSPKPFVADQSEDLALVAPPNDSHYFLCEVGETALKSDLPGMGGACGAVDWVDATATGFSAGSAYLLAFEPLPSPAWICASRLSRRRDMSSTAHVVSTWFTDDIA